MGSRETVYLSKTVASGAPGSAEALTASRRHDQLCAISSGQDKGCPGRCAQTWEEQGAGN